MDRMQKIVSGVIAADPGPDVTPKTFSSTISLRSATTSAAPGTADISS